MIGFMRKTSIMPLINVFLLQVLGYPYRLMCHVAGANKTLYPYHADFPEALAHVDIRMSERDVRQRLSSKS